MTFQAEYNTAVREVLKGKTPLLRNMPYEDRSDHRHSWSVKTFFMTGDLHCQQKQKTECYTRAVVVMRLSKRQIRSVK